MNSFIALILGFVEGMTEFLPVSSTGHLILASNALGLENTEFLKLFEIVIQTGAILAVIFIYWKELLDDRSYFLKLAVAFIPTGVLGLLFYKIIKQYLFTPWVVCSALFVGGIVLLFLETFTAKIPTRKQTYFHLFLLGVFQCFAFIPGVSRSAATILGGRLLGATREEAVKFSFLLAIPTILSASGYSLLKVKHAITPDEIMYLSIGLISSFVFGFISVKVFLKWLNHQTFVLCGIYRIVFAIMYYFVFIQ
ncbi:MAG: undecaprenyl-diphosphate phosphatase [Bacteriovoracia bacterium]